jgi:hypothetical protein
VSYEDYYQPGRIYPMKRRRWPIVVGLLVSALIVATCSWAYNVTTSTPLVDKPAPATSGAAK